MSALLLVPAPYLAFAALGSALRAFGSLWDGEFGEAAGRMAWCVALAAGAWALVSIAMGRPA